MFCQKLHLRETLKIYFEEFEEVFITFFKDLQKGENKNPTEFNPFCTHVHPYFNTSQYAIAE